MSQNPPRERRRALHLLENKKSEMVYCLYTLFMYLDIGVRRFHQFIYVYRN